MKHIQTHTPVLGLRIEHLTCACVVMCAYHTDVISTINKKGHPFQHTHFSFSPGVLAFCAPTTSISHAVWCCARTYSFTIYMNCCGLIVYLPLVKRWHLGNTHSFGCLPRARRARARVLWWFARVLLCLRCATHCYMYYYILYSMHNTTRGLLHLIGTHGRRRQTDIYYICRQGV